MKASLNENKQICFAKLLSSNISTNTNIPFALHNLRTVKNNINKQNIIQIIDKIRSRLQPSSKN